MASIGKDLSAKFILAYKAFKSTEDFEAWQAENPDLDVVSISPFLGSADLNFKEHDQEARIEANLTVFVVFRKQIAKLEPSDLL